MKRRVFYSFHYKPDSWRAAQVRNIGVIEGNKPATDNDWETVKRGGELAIKRWIARQLKGRSCCLVLIGSNTADRQWLNCEIIESWNAGMGVVGIYVHGLKNLERQTSPKGRDPFDFIEFSKQGRRLS
ncbi:MAG: TIR domain-containing protein [Rhodobacteraceae bacterium]|nr:TIR domain-containing protein [Paracoccaceae bacterium]